MMASSNTTECLKLASASEVVKIWDSSSYEMCYQLTYKNISSFQSVGWSSDLLQIVSVPVQGEKVLLSLLRPKGPPQYAEIIIKGCTAAQFCTSSSRFLGVGTKDGSTLIWDLKHKKPTKTFSGFKSEVTCLQFNWNDSCIATGFANGSVVLHNTVTNMSSAPLTAKNIERIQSLQYNYSKSPLIGCASQDGSVLLWDSNTKLLNNRFTDHYAPATGLRFSPTNNLLLVSVGLDKKINLYDVRCKEKTKTQECEVPLTAVDFKEDGITLVVGCTRGKIYFYDLRFPLFPVQVVDAHKTSVHALAFQNTVYSAASKKSASRKAEPNKSDAGSLYDPLKNSQDEKMFDFSSICSDLEITKDTINVLKEKKGSLTGDIFSPVQDSPYSKEISKNVKNSSFFGNQNLSFAAFSPLQNQNASVSSAKSYLSPEDSFIFKDNETSLCNTTKKISPPLKLQTKSTYVAPTEALDSTDKNGSLKHQILKAALSPQSVSGLGLCSRSGDCSATMWSCNSADSRVSESSVHDVEIVRQQPKLLESVNVTSDFAQLSSDIKETKNEESDTCVSKNSAHLTFDSADLPEDEGKGTSKSTTPLTPQVFQVEFFKQLIVDAMEDHADAMRKGFYQMHVQMARQFERQRDEIEELFLKYSRHPDSVLEMKKCRENHYLQNIFR